MWVFKRIDWSWSDWGFALGQCVAPLELHASLRSVEALWSPDGDALACLSVRSAFDLFLRAVDWAPGDEIVFTGYTHAHMPWIARQHGLRVHPVDIDPMTTLPDPDEVAAALTDRTRMVVFTHLFGAQLDVSELRALTAERGVRLMEDCAQAYAGPEWKGHPESDLVLFSFGPLKNATALGGCLGRVRDEATRNRMRTLRDADPTQPAGDFLKRLLAYGALHAVTNPGVFGLVADAAALAGRDHQDLGNKLTRAFPGPGLTPRIRRRPSAPLAALLERRVRQGREAVEPRIRAGEHLLAALGPEVPVPAGRHRPHAFWLIPVLAEEPRHLRSRLRKAGIDAMGGRSFSVVEDDTGWAGGLAGARRLHEGAVYLPFSPEMPPGVLEAMARTVVSLL
jgi:dTDP-4-amino-4,6-dideoxygalactose transaminase